MHQFYSIKNIFVLKCIFIVLTVFPFKNFRSQNHKIDSLIEVSRSERSDGDFQKFFAKQNIILKESKKKKYSKGIAVSYYYIGTCYQRSGDCGKALFFLNSALKEKYTQTDQNLESYIMTNIGNCYVQQSLYKEALEKYLLAIKIGDISEGDINYIRSINYCSIGSLYETSKISEDSAYRYYSQAYYYVKNYFKSKQTDKQTIDKKGNAATICLSIGDIWKKKNRIDSAKYYYNKAILYNSEAKDIIFGAVLEHTIGALNYNSHDYKKAEYHLEKAKKIFEEKKDIYSLPEIYTLLSEVNKKLGNEKKSSDYQNLLINTNLKINEIQDSARMPTVENVIKERNEVFSRKELRLYWIIAAILLITLFVIIYSVYFHKRKKNDSVSMLKKERDIIQQKELEADELKIKINESFDEVVQLAKDNSPEFFIRFQEMYPKVCPAILKINPNMVSSELKFCALLFLNFSTKDIAEYTFTSPKTVQNRKNGIRKKLNIPSDTDLYIWFKNL